MVIPLESHQRLCGHAALRRLLFVNGLSRFDARRTDERNCCKQYRAVHGCDDMMGVILRVELRRYHERTF